MDSKVVDAEEDSKSVDIDEFDFNYVFENEKEYTFVCDSTPSGNDDIVCDLQGNDHVSMRKINET